MTLPQQIAKHVRDFHFGGNATGVNLKDTLADVSWQQAVTKVHSFNTIALLVFHINYYISAVLKVLQGGPLDASDKFSFDCPPIESQEDWDRLVNKVFTEAETYASLIEQLPDNDILGPFLDGKYGTVFRNIHGINEHSYYHLGQITLIKKLLNAETTGSPGK